MYICLQARSQSPLERGPWVEEQFFLLGGGCHWRGKTLLCLQVGEKIIDVGTISFIVGRGESRIALSGHVKGTGAGKGYLLSKYKFLKMVDRRREGINRGHGPS